MLNKTILMGRICGELELRHTPNNTAVTSFTLAVERDIKGADGQRQTDFIDIVAWGKTAEFTVSWFAKGQLVAVCGHIQCRNWEDKQGNKRKSVEVIADELHFTGDKKELHQGPGSEPNLSDVSTSDFTELSEDDGELPF